MACVGETYAPGDTRRGERCAHYGTNLCLTGATAAVAACPQVTQAETYPSRPVRILVAFPRYDECAF
jgi:hypothetical protein